VRTLALIIGNSHLHWAWFHRDELQASWHTRHLTKVLVDQWIAADLDLCRLDEIAAPIGPDFWLGSDEDRLVAGSIGAEVPDQLLIASVVPVQTSLWLRFPRSRLLTLADIPLVNLYPTLGIDRALAAFGSGETLGYPTLVVDCGTALTFTGIDPDRRLVGGAILPGFGLQLRSLTQQTAALPALSPYQWMHRTSPHLPQRWAQDTETAIASGVLYTLIAGIQAFGQDWLLLYPQSTIALTGGDSATLWAALKKLVPEIGDRSQCLPDVGFAGVAAFLRNQAIEA